MNEPVYHVPVLLQEVLDGLNIRPGGVYVDFTFGGGGHAGELLKRLNAQGRLVVFEQDADVRQQRVRALGVPLRRGSEEREKRSTESDKSHGRELIGPIRGFLHVRARVSRARRVREHSVWNAKTPRPPRRRGKSKTGRRHPQIAQMDAD